MNHLPLPKNPAYPPIEVPYCGLMYHREKCKHVLTESLCDNCVARGFQGWYHFPDRMGWKTTNVSMNKFSRNGRDDHAGAIAMLQAWLWFGLLDVFFEHVGAVDANGFLSDNSTSNGSASLDTSTLPAHLSVWEPWTRSLPSEQRDIYIQNIKGILREISVFCHTHFDERALEKSRCPLPQEVQLSIIVLGHTLSHAIHVITDDLRNTESFGRCNLMVQRLQDNSWCPSDPILTQGSVAYFAMMMGAKSYQPRANHKDCQVVCHEADIEEGSYATKHAAEDCDCEYYHAPPNFYAQTILNGKMPVFLFRSKRVADDMYREEREDVLGGDISSLGYTAISHVWANGLGNPRANSLPLCQIHLIQYHVNALYGLQDQNDISAPFFMDTLCIPVVDPATDEYELTKSARESAISWMSDIYSKANRVLVIDSDLQKSCTKETDVVELFLRLATSRWAHRLWTLHECVLSKIIFIQLSDGVFRIADIIDELDKRVDERCLWDPITYEVNKWSENLSTLRSSFDHEETDGQFSENRIIGAFICASERSTSHKKDEVVILAALAGFDKDQIRTLLDHPKSSVERDYPSHQSVQFLSTLGKIPKQLLLARGLRCPGPGLRACPTDLLNAWRESPGGSLYIEFHEITPLGVQGCWDSIRMKFNTTEHFSVGSWKDETIIVFPVKLVPTGEWRRVGITTLSQDDILQACCGKDLAILFHGDDTVSGEKIIAGILVTVEPTPAQGGRECEREVIHAHWVARTTFTSINKVEQRTWDFASNVLKHDLPMAEQIQSGQVWCVD